MLKKILMSLLIFAFYSVNAQDKDQIKKSNDYYWGQSQVYDTYEKAKNSAVDLMLKNIAENISFSPIEIQASDPDVYKEKILLTLENKISYKRKLINVVRDTKNDEYSCMAYISKDDFNVICDERTDEIQRYADNGKQKEEEHLMVDALRSYYWGMLLCVAHPQGKTVKIELDNEPVLAYEYLKGRVAEVLDSFTFAVSKNNPGEFNDEGISVILNVRADDNDVTGLQFRYYNGDDYIRTMVNNGKAEVQLRNKEMRDFDIKIEYDFSHEIIAH
ncbi:MAG: hypothetical protein J6Q61_05170, partial [Bacteroidales bacterium]|nr:hypothetical protein [Bacteroidales bacterium]